MAQSATFGPFELNCDTGELKKRGIRVRLAGQPLNVLLLLLDRPGEVVTSDEIRQKLWGDGTFVDFEHSLHAAISKLRRALGDSADNSRYVETIPGVGYRFIGVLAAAESRFTPSPSPPVVPRRSHWPKISAVALCLVCVAAGWLLGRRRPEPDDPVHVIRLTNSTGLDDKPALSGDGKLLAFSSNRGPDGRNLYVKHVAGGETLQLTFDGLGNTSPDFSPDGTQIVFHSDHDGGGIYIIPTLGGSPRFLAHRGQSLRLRWPPTWGKRSCSASIRGIWARSGCSIGIGFFLPPPCIYLFPATIPSPRNNPHPVAQSLDDVHLLKASHACVVRRVSALSCVLGRGGLSYPPVLWSNPSSGTLPFPEAREGGW